jgi:hypothetical protein
MTVIVQRGGSGNAAELATYIVGKGRRSSWALGEVLIDRDSA